MQSFQISHRKLDNQNSHKRFIQTHCKLVDQVISKSEILFFIVLHNYCFSVVHFPLSSTPKYCSELASMYHCLSLDIIKSAHLPCIYMPYTVKRYWNSPFAYMVGLVLLDQ